MSEEHAPRSPGFGEVLRRYRLASGLSQEELGERSGLSVRAVSNIERGRTRRPYRKTVASLAAALELHGARREEFVRASRVSGALWPDTAGIVPQHADFAGPVAPAARIPAPSQSSETMSSGKPRKPPDGSNRPESLPDPQHDQFVRASRTGAAPSLLTGGVTPRQLPAAVSHFVGRAAELRALEELLGQVDKAGAAVVSVIGGTAGVGKTALAVHWAHRVAGRFPDGQVYLDLRGFDPSGKKVTPAEALRLLLDALQVPAQQIPASLDAQAGLYRSLLAGKRVLLVLDNAGNADQVRPLLPGSPGCMAVVTSRTQMTSLVAAHDARPLDLDMFSTAEARDFLAGRLGPDRATSQPAAVNQLISLCGRLPLALAIVAARAAVARADLLISLASELQDSQRQLSALDAGDVIVSVRAVFSWSYRDLSEPAARMFRLLGLHPGPDISLPAAASLAAARLLRAREHLADLTRANLVSEHAPGRYSLHDLLRAYAGELAHAVESESDRRVALHRVLDHYLHTTCAAARILHPNAEQVALPSPQPAVVVPDLGGYEEAMTWLEAERPVLLAAITRAGGTGFDTHVVKLGSALRIFLDRRAYWDEYASTQQAALDAATRLRDKEGQARAYQGLGNASIRLGAFDDGRRHITSALDLCRQLDDRAGQGLAYSGLAWLAEQQGRLGDALANCVRALDMFAAIGDRARQATLLNNTGWCHARLGDFPSAAKCCKQASTLYQELGDLHGQAAAQDSLGYTCQQLGDHSQAADCYERAAELCGQLGDPNGRAIALAHLGDTHKAAGRPEHARGAWTAALAILDQLHHRDAEQVRAKVQNLG